MKQLLTAMILFLGASLFAQPTIQFRDGKSLAIEGEKLGTNILYDFFDPAIEEKMVEYYWKETNGTVTVYEYTTWLTVNNKGKMDELRIITIAINQQSDNPIVEENPDDSGKVINYRLKFHFQDEMPVKVEVYNIYESKPKQVKEISYLDIYNIEKTGFELLVEKMKLSETHVDEISE